MSANGNALFLHERRYSEHKHKNIYTAEDQNEVVGLLEEDRIAGRFRSGHHGGMNGGNFDGSERKKVRGWA
jgi:hypothetical protein